MKTIITTKYGSPDVLKVTESVKPIPKEDEILIKIASKDTSPKLLHRIKDHFRAKLRVAPKIEFHDKKEIQKLQSPIMSRKPIIVIDKRL